MKIELSQEASQLIDFYKNLCKKPLIIDDLLILLDKAIEIDSTPLFEAVFFSLTNRAFDPFFPNKPLFGKKLISRGLNSGLDLIEAELNFVNFDNIERPIFYDLTKEHVLNPFIYYLVEKVKLWTKAAEAMELIFNLNSRINFGATQWSTQAIRQEDGTIEYSFIDTGSNLFHLIIHNDPAIFDEYLSLKLLRYLVNNNVDINAKDKNGCTPLYLACKKGNLVIILFLINNGADKTCFDEAKDLYAPLTKPLLRLNKYVVRLLASLGVELSPRYYIPTDLIQPSSVKVQENQYIDSVVEEDLGDFDDFKSFLNSTVTATPRRISIFQEAQNSDERKHPSSHPNWK